MNRQENLIQILLKAEKPLTTQELAEQLKCQQPDNPI